MVGDLFTVLDDRLAWVIPEAARLLLWAAASGVLSMMLYARTSPQRRLRELRDQSVGLQKQLAAYDGDFAGAMVLTRQNLSVSLRRLALALGPSLLAGAPVLLALFGLAGAYENYQLLTLGPSWMRSWLFGFLVVTTFAALGTKVALKIT